MFLRNAISVSLIGIASLGVAACGGADPESATDTAPNAERGGENLRPAPALATDHYESHSGDSSRCEHHERGWYRKEGYCVSQSWCDPSHGHVMNGGSGCRCDDGYEWDSHSQSCQSGGGCSGGSCGGGGSNNWHCSHGDSDWYWKSGYCVSRSWCDTDHGHVMNGGSSCECDSGYFWHGESRSCRPSPGGCFHGVCGGG